MQRTFDQLKVKVLESGLATPDSIVPCTDEDIAEIESVFKVRLPATYREFLRLFGREAGWLLQGSDYLYPEVLKCREAAQELLDYAEVRFELQPEYFVFLQHQGYQFLYFDTTNGDDPAVCRFIEGDESPHLVRSTFSAWLAECIADECILHESTKATRERCIENP